MHPGGQGPEIHPDLEWEAAVDVKSFEGGELRAVSVPFVLGEGGKER